MSKLPTISVLMPVRNAMPFLKDCLNSILNQTIANWELIAINDHSTDDSFEVLQAYQQKDPRIHIYQNEGKGIIPALQTAFKHSKGELISRMDADDRMPSNKLALLKEQLLQKGKGYLSTGLVKYFSEGTLGDGYIRYEEWLNNLTIQENNFKEIYKECVIPSPCWMIYRTDLLEIGAFESDIYPEDYELCFRFYEAQLKVIGIPEVLHFWRDHPERSSRNDPNYANIHYFDLKLLYFLKLDYDKNRTLVLWGTGQKGKILAKKLSAESIPFHWYSNNPNKIGHTIYGKNIKHFRTLKLLETPQIIVAIAGPEDQTEIKGYLKELKLRPSRNYFFFC